MLTHAGEVQWTHPAERPNPDEASEDEQNDNSDEGAADVEGDDDE
jgi:hypothetical protein